MGGLHPGSVLERLDQGRSFPRVYVEAKARLNLGRRREGQPTLPSFGQTKEEVAHGAAEGRSEGQEEVGKGWAFPGVCPQLL